MFLNATKPIQYIREFRICPKFWIIMMWNPAIVRTYTEERAAFVGLGLTDTILVL
jgi:hypothetical protein